MNFSVVMLAALLLVAAPGAAAKTVWTLRDGSFFFDSSAEKSQRLTGTITTELVEGDGEWRHFIRTIDIKGKTVRFVEASFGGGAIDIRKPNGPMSQAQIIIGDPDSSRFKSTSGSVSFRGPAKNPTSFQVRDLDPFMFGGHDLEAADRLTLVLSPADEIRCEPLNIDPRRDFPCHFDVAMTRNASTRVWVANFPLPGHGNFSELRYDLFRDTFKVFDMSTYGVTLVRESKGVRLKVNAWDKQDESGEFDHRIKGVLLLKPDPED